MPTLSKIFSFHPVWLWNWTWLFFCEQNVVIEQLHVCFFLVWFCLYWKLHPTKLPDIDARKYPDLVEILRKWETAEKSMERTRTFYNNNNNNNGFFCVRHFLYMHYILPNWRVHHSDSWRDSTSKGNECMLFILSAPGILHSKNAPQETSWYTLWWRKKKENCWGG